ncbi:acetylornithine transaminase [Enteractinococcus coprophilus]|uniref:Acetylornithine aminotransferase n=1 Tax=Enteractinococcus coprophilus TaxID=1027633 RepID=A0A543AJY1_9MICC|nr:acetylornithine transaminase [Enteractinococcus coprophilus]TQL72895.1 acetylornithine aminotransferase [Enteractinococcus coprophilus]
MTENLLERYQRSMTNMFGTPARALVKGEGVYVWDADGKRYTDLLAGIAVNALGHAHPAIVDALTEQAKTLGHISNLFTSLPQVGLAERLLAMAGISEGAAFFANSGTEANEAAFKLARRHSHAQGGSRPKVIALQNAFHGRTMGALALTWKPQYREPFEPLPGGVVFVPAGDIDALTTEMDDTVAAVIIEPVQGEAGVRDFPPGYLQQVRQACDDHGALLIFDEIQSGIGRTGTWFAFQNPEITGTDEPVFPDAMTLAKGLGGGMPIGALVTFGSEVSELFAAGQHGTTFGGNPLATATALAVLDTIESEDLLDNVRSVGAYLAQCLHALPIVKAVRAYGLWQGIELDTAAIMAQGMRLPDGGLAPKVVAKALDYGYIINATDETTLRLAPPLIITIDQVDPLIQDLPNIVAETVAEAN